MGNIKELLISLKFPILISLVALSLPPFVGKYGQTILISIFVNIALAVSTSILLNTGQTSLGQTAFFGIGAYTTFILYKSFVVPRFVGLFLGGIVAAIAAVFLGIVCLRLRGVYLAIATLAFAEALKIAFLRFKTITGGIQGIFAYPLFGGNRLVFFYIIFAISATTIFLAVWLKNSKLGLASSAIRMDQDAAESLGISSPRIKLIAFTISAFLTGIVGGFSAIYICYIEPLSMFLITRSAICVFIPIIGGLYSVEGPIIGAIVWGLLGEGLRSRVGGTSHLFVFGVMVILVMVLMPEGIVNGLKRLANLLQEKPTSQTG